VDYADPTLPVIDDTGINLPGALRGVARQGKLLFTAGRNYDLTTGAAKAGSALQVSGFDGTAAHLLDTLPLTSLTQPLVIQDETIFTLDAQPAYTWVNGPYQPIDGFRLLSATVMNQYWWGGTWQPNDKTSLLSEWKLDSAGKFSKFDDIEAAHDTALHVFGDLVVTQDSNRTLHLFDASGASQLESLGDFTFDGWVWPDLDHAAGGLQTGLWVPLGQYGVEIVAEPQPAAN
jgi:hypothetical protein